MEIIRNNSFANAFVQGLAVVFFLYVLIFTISIFHGHPGGSLAPLATAKIAVERQPENLPQAGLEPSQQQTPQQGLNPADQAPAPEAAAPITPAPQATQTSPPAPAVPTMGPGSVHEDLIETTPDGPMPRRAGTLTPFAAWKKPFTDKGKPVIALALLNYGLSETDSKQAANTLPPEVSFILNPYAQTPDTWKGLAGAAGREFWIFVPAENQAYPDKVDPGPQALLAHSDFKYNQEKFTWALTRTTGYAGFASYTDAAFLNAQTALKAMWDQGYDRGLAYFEINPAGLDGVEVNADQKAAPYVRDQSIYDEASQTPDQWLKALELEANNNGYAIGIIQKPDPNIIEAVSAWAKDLNSRGLVLAPVSALAQVKNDVAPAKKDAAPPTPAPAAPAAPAAAVPPKDSHAIP